MPRTPSILLVALLLPFAGATGALGAAPGPIRPRPAHESGAVQSPAAIALAQPRSVEKFARGPEGERLPFYSHEEAVEFLRTATVIETEEIGGSRNRPLKLLLEKDGVRAHAVFRSVRRTWQREWFRGTWYTHLIDRASSERAAYVVARMLGFDNIPPTALRKIDGRQGSLQLWLEGVDSAADRATRHGDFPDGWNEQMAAIWAFDNLVFNLDRHPGNLLIGADGTVWMIDHTQAFQYNKRLLDSDQVLSIPQTMWERLQTIPDSTFEEALAEALNGTQIGAFLERRRRLVEHIEDLIAERGEERVVRPVRVTG